MQTALYRAERPEVFEEIIGQKHIVKILKNQLKTGTVSQAYLFAGTHGTGKTSTARILAKAVNCTSGGDNLPCGKCENCEAIREGRFVDCIELDAASNNGVEDLRAIVDMVKYPPSIGKYKVYIIDEVHMLSPSAENAFLKTLEEPPEHAIFILATTDPQKVRATIRSRCMQLNFKRVTEDELVAGMQRICERRSINADEEALRTIASRSGGSVRDALSILEQCMASGDEKLDRAAVLEYTGAAGEDFFLALTDAVLTGDSGKALVYIDEIIKRGKDARQIIKDWAVHFRDVMIAKYVNNPDHILSASEESISRLRSQAAPLDADYLDRAIRLLSEYVNIGRYSERPRILLETAAVKLASGRGGREEPVTPKSSEKIKTEPADKAKNDRATAAQPDAVISDEAGAPDVAETLDINERPQEMWERIIQEVAATDRSFVSLVGHHSEATDFDSGVLLISVRPGKIRMAEEKLKEITEIARRLYGSGIIINLKSADPGDDSRKTREMTEKETAEILKSDTALSEAALDIEELFGMKPTIES